MLHLRLIVPVDRTDRARSLLADHQGVTNLVVLPGAGVRPEGDLVLADVARESANHVLDELTGLGLTRRGSIAVEGVDLSLSAGADRAEDQAPGKASDAVVWAELAARAKEESTLSATYLSFFSVAIILAGIAVLLDSVDPRRRRDDRRAGVRGAGRRLRRGRAAPVAGRAAVRWSRWPSASRSASRPPWSPPGCSPRWA